MWQSARVRRGCAAGAALAAGAGSVGLAVAVVGLSDLRGFVSEAGVAGAPGAGLYRVSVVTLAVACGLLAVALRPAAGAAALALGAAAPFTGVSGAVTCTPGCPLPPYERSTPADVAHAGASILALSLSTLAMLVLALSADASAVRRVSRFSLALTLPLLVAAAFAIFGLGRGLVAGLTERAGLFSTLGWLVAAAAVQVARVRPGRPAPAAGRPAADGLPAAVPTSPRRNPPR